MFPSNDVFSNFGGIGVSMFFVTSVKPTHVLFEVEK